MTQLLRRAAGALAAALAVAALLPAPAAEAFGVVHGVRLDAVEARLVALINHARASRGIPGLTVVPGYVDVARRWSAYQARHGVLQHNPNLVANVVSSGGGSWGAIAENVGRGATADSLFVAYMNSAGHRANILDRSMRYLGMGWVERPDGSGYNTQVFADAYSSAYGGVRDPAYGGRADMRRYGGSGVLADFEAGSEPRGLTVATAPGLAVGGMVLETPGSGDQAARFGVAQRSGGTGGGGELRLRDAVDFSNVRALSVSLGAITRTGKPLLVEVHLRTVLGISVRVGAMWVPHGGTKTATFTLPAAAKGFRNEVAVHVSRSALASLDPSSYAGRAATVRVLHLGVVV